MRCKLCNQLIEYRLPNTVYEHPDDKYICGECLDLINDDHVQQEFYDLNLETEDEIQRTVNGSRTPPKFIE